MVLPAWWAMRSDRRSFVFSPDESAWLHCSALQCRSGAAAVHAATPGAGRGVRCTALRLALAALTLLVLAAGQAGDALAEHRVETMRLERRDALMEAPLRCIRGHRISARGPRYNRLTAVGFTMGDSWLYLGSPRRLDARDGAGVGGTSKCLF